MNREQAIRDKILQNSISLEGYGINDLAWTKESAKKLINEIIDDEVGILGGDIYKLSHDRLEPLCDNWACEPNETESDEEYYFRSKSESLTYIEKYPIQQGEKILFSITFTEKIT